MDLVEKSKLNSKLIHKLLLVTIKYIPIIQMVGMLLNNTLYHYDIYSLTYILDFIIGNSFINTLLIVICSYIFKFCIWHRLIILANFINIIIASKDSINKINIYDAKLLSIYYIVYAIAIMIITYIHIRNVRRKKTKNI